MNTERIFGMDVIICAGVPKMQCTPKFARLQSPDLVASLNQWYADFFGYTELIPDGQVMHDRVNGRLLMSSKTAAHIQKMKTQMGYQTHSMFSPGRVGLG